MLTPADAPRRVVADAHADDDDDAAAAAAADDAHVVGEVCAEVGAAPASGLRFETRVARDARERADYFALRRAIFCDEQGLFVGDDRDACDEIAIPIVCLAAAAPGGRARVVGVVRTWEEAPGDWWGGRLGVDRDFRTVGAIGRWLVQTAVGSARAWGARRFRATVQLPNVAFFRRLRWQTSGELEILGRPHQLMEARLDHYLPTSEARPADAGPAGRAACEACEACDDAA